VIAAVTIGWKGVVAMAALVLFGMLTHRRWPLYVVGVWVVMSVVGVLIFGLGDEVSERPP
jgi:hypothetical protein